MKRQRRGAIAGRTPNILPHVGTVPLIGISIPGMTTCYVLVLSAAIPLDSSTFLPLWAGFSLIWAELHTTLGKGPGSDCTMYGHTGLESPEEALRPQILPRVDHQGAPTCGVGMLHPRPGSLIAELQVHRDIFVGCLSYQRATSSYQGPGLLLSGFSMRHQMTVAYRLASQLLTTSCQLTVQ